MNLRDAFERTVRVHGADPAVVTASGETYTYEEFDRRSTRLANALADRVGDAPVAVLSLNRPAAAEAMVAGLKRGAANVQLPYRAKTAELVAMAETADARALLFDEANRETAVEMLDEGDFEAALYAGGGDGGTDTSGESAGAESGDAESGDADSVDTDSVDVEPYESALADASPDPLDAPPEGATTNVFYTSGTTSRPKAVAFDAHQMWLGAYQGVMEHGIDQTDVAIVTTPWYHMVTTDAWLYPHWLAGATTVLHESFDPEEVLALVEEFDATGLLAVPTQLDSLNGVQAAADAEYDTSSLNYVRTGGAVLTEGLVEATAEHLCEDLYNTYGLTEGGPNLTFAHPSVQSDHPGTVGKESFAWELRVVDSAPIDEHPDPEATVDAGERGEVIARGPGVPDGYIDNPEAESRTFFGEWLRTCDVARVDEDGFVYVLDRVDNMFVSGGENVYPAEVERALTDHEAVAEALVFGMADDHWGRQVTAIVGTDGSVDAEALDAFCLAHETLADFKRPREYAIRSEPLPRTDTGTIEREVAIEEHFG